MNIRKTRFIIINDDDQDGVIQRCDGFKYLGIKFKKKNETMIQ